MDENKNPELEWLKVLVLNMFLVLSVEVKQLYDSCGSECGPLTLHSPWKSMLLPWWVSNWWWRRFPPMSWSESVSNCFFSVWIKISFAPWLHMRDEFTNSLRGLQSQQHPLNLLHNFTCFSFHHLSLLSGCCGDSQCNYKDCWERRDIWSIFQHQSALTNT